MGDTGLKNGFRMLAPCSRRHRLRACAGLDGSAPASRRCPARRRRGAGRDRDHERLVAAFGGEATRAAGPAPADRHHQTPDRGQATARRVVPDHHPQFSRPSTPSRSRTAGSTSRAGLLALANDTSEIAAVLSHEIAHVTLRHASQRSELQARSTLIKRVTENVLNDAKEAAAMQNQSRSTLGELLPLAGTRSRSGRA